MDEPYLLAAARYVELNPVRAGLVARACEWPWSSARAHLSGRDDRLVQVAPLQAMIPDWAAFLDTAVAEEELRDYASTGPHRPAAGERFFPRPPGGHGWPHPEAAEGRSALETQGFLDVEDDQLAARELQHEVADGRDRDLLPGAFDVFA